MKQVRAIIRHEVLEPVRNALEKLGVPGMTITEVKGFGHQRGHTETYRGAQVKIHFRPKIELLTIINNEQLDTVVEAITTNARTGAVGDGKIFVTSVEQVYRIRTGESGNKAI
ncbi:MAG: P-II family nitrogen regulator [Actinomycetia bacterium]|nr:P-II family nitrogen regulator [Actinomycetes bacterium]